MRKLTLCLFLLGCSVPNGSIDPNTTACGGQSNGTAACGNGGGSGGGNGGGTGGSTGGTTGNIPVPTCGEQTFPIGLTQQEPNVLLVLDKSGSMQDPIPGTTDTKWDTAKNAIFSLLKSYVGKVRWGLAVFPKLGGAKCDAGDLQIPFGDDRAQAIIDLLTPITSASIGGSTPTETTLQNLQMTGGLDDVMRNNYILLLTDGLPTCNQDGKVTPVVASLYAQSPSVRTFVVGLGADTDSNPAQLDEWAVAGHTDVSGAAHKYYQANNITDLSSAFAAIAAGIASCTYQLSMAPADPSLVVVQVDGQAIATDPVNGVVYDPGSQSITFYGTSCDAIKSGAAKQVNLVYGCPAPPVK